MPTPLREAVGLPVGEEGGYFVGVGCLFPVGNDVLDENNPPHGQPGLWCQWVPNEDGTRIEWSGNEKFYNYVDWIKYLIGHFLQPWGRLINGNVIWQGEELEDRGTIIIVDNEIMEFGSLAENNDRFTRRETMKIEKIVSGGQIGADLAGLDVAIRHDLPHGGWCPAGRKSLAGPIPERYHLTETRSSSYLVRTELNVRDSDGTVVFTLESEPTGGSLRTIQFAAKYNRPCLHLSPHVGESAAKRLRRFIDESGIKVLNVAGSRERVIYEWVSTVLEEALFKGRGFLAGDVVHHLPTGEEWVLAVDEEGNRVMPCGWPATLAEASDCRLVEAATAESRMKMLERWARTDGGYEHENDWRTLTARRQIAP